MERMYWKYLLSQFVLIVYYTLQELPHISIEVRITGMSQG